MKHLTLTLIAILAIGTSSAQAKYYPAYGPDSYQAQHGINKSGTLDTRKGFRLGLGVGIANTDIDNYFDYSETGFATSFEIGYAPSNHLSINYLNNVNWASSEYNDYTGSFDGVSGASALTLNYYIDNTPDTLYLVGGIAAGVADSEAEVAGLIGIGYAVGNVEFEIDGVFGENYDNDMRQIFFTVSYFFF